MIETILLKVGATIVLGAIVIAGFFGLVPQGDLVDLQLKVDQLEEQVQSYEDIKLGAYYPVAGDTYYLSGSGISSTDVSIVLQSFKVDEEELTMENFGGVIGYLTLEPGNTSKKEFISFTAISQSGSSDKATLSGVTRGLERVYPYGASSTLGVSHSGGTRAIISNPPQHYQKYAGLEQDATITAEWNFNTATPTRYNATMTSAQASSDDRNIVDYYTVRTVATSGAANALYDITGIVQLATTSELSIGTATSSAGVYLVVPSELVHASSSATRLIALTRDSGKFEQGFLDLTEEWSFSNLVSATTTITNAVSLTVNTATSTATSTDNFNLLPAGMIQMYASATAPTGWLLADGSDYASTTYPRLFEVIGYQYGSSTGNFKLPDFKSRTARGYASATSSVDVLGETGGRETVSTSTFAHSHTGTLNLGNNSEDGATPHFVTNSTFQTSTTSPLSEDLNILDPYITVNYIIKY